MGSTLHQLCPGYSGTLTLTVPTAIRLWETVTFSFGAQRDFLEILKLTRCSVKFHTVDTMKWHKLANTSLVDNKVFWSAKGRCYQGCHGQGKISGK